MLQPSLCEHPSVMPLSDICIGIYVRQEYLKVPPSKQKETPPCSIPILARHLFSCCAYMQSRCSGIPSFQTSATVGQAPSSRTLKLNSVPQSPLPICPTPSALDCAWWANALASCERGHRIHLASTRSSRVYWCLLKPDSRTTC